jgi:hypothetical protein
LGGERAGASDAADDRAHARLGAPPSRRAARIADIAAAAPPGLVVARRGDLGMPAPLDIEALRARNRARILAIARQNRSAALG